METPTMSTTPIAPCATCGQWPAVMLYDDGSVALWFYDCEHRTGDGQCAPQECGIPAVFPASQILGGPDGGSLRITHEPLLDPSPSAAVTSV